MTVSKPTVVFVAAEPKGVSTIRLGSEFRKIVRKARSLDFETLWAAQPEDVADAVQAKKPALIHFSAHGTAAGNLVLENEIGDPKEVTPKGLGSFFGAHGRRVRIVILNSCYSEMIAREIVQYVDGVVAMNDPIGIEAAIRFSTGFYRALAAGDSLHHSFRKGKAEIDLQNVGGGDIPVLVTRPGVEPWEVFLESESTGSAVGNAERIRRSIKAKDLHSKEDTEIFDAEDIEVEGVNSRGISISGGSKSP